MTENAKNRWTVWAGSLTITLIGIFVGASVSDKSNLESKVHQIEVQKVDKSEFEAKCKEIKDEAAIDKQEILIRLDALQGQNNQIYQILIQKK